MFGMDAAGRPEHEAPRDPARDDQVVLAPDGQSGPLAMPDSPTPKFSPPPPAIDASRFVAGTVIANRYRIVARLGKGGMGEVFRAEDLTLNLPVALKFLPAATGAKAAIAVENLINEVRTARRIGHPNVCRVYDVGMHEGGPFVSMEFVDGEDLATLLNRIGRLPEDRGTAIARQLCSGLAAAHEQGVFHRDLKPSNVMIDGKGRPRIVDFGLAALQEELRRDRRSAGTPAFMAPEQLFGSPANAKTDLFSLGLVLFELFTGKPAFAPKTLDELVKLHEKGPPTLSSIIPDIDRAIERTIMRCLERVPENRPSSALMVAAGLPGGDALTAALEAGVTPSPEVVAAAGERSVWPWQKAVIWFVAALLGIVGSIEFVSYVNLVNRVPLTKSGEVLADRAMEILNDLGEQPRRRDHLYGFDIFEEYIAVLARQSQKPDRWSRLSWQRPAAIDFWYRQSPRGLAPLNPLGLANWNDPPGDIPGTSLVRLDPGGLLRELRLTPTQSGDDAIMYPDRPRSEAPPALATQLFAAAGLDIQNFRLEPPGRMPQMYVDERWSWSGHYPEAPDTSIRIETGWLEGRPVSFRVVEPQFNEKFWKGVPKPEGVQRWAIGASFALRLACIGGGIALATVNLRRRKGDRVSAAKLGVSVGVLMLLAQICRAKTLDAADGLLSTVSLMTADACLVGLIFWVAYLALEPNVRRHWPQTLPAWSRLLAGRLTDPMIGRSLLTGVAAGTGFIILLGAERLLQSALGLAVQQPIFIPNLGLSALEGSFSRVGALLSCVVLAVYIGTAFLLAAVLLQIFVKNR